MCHVSCVTEEKIQSLGLTVDALFGQCLKEEEKRFFFSGGSVINGANPFKFLILITSIYKFFLTMEVI